MSSDKVSTEGTNDDADYCSCGKRSPKANFRCSEHETCQALLKSDSKKKRTVVCGKPTDGSFCSCIEHTCRKCGNNVIDRHPNYRSDIMRKMLYCKKCRESSYLMRCTLCTRNGKFVNAEFATLSMPLPGSCIKLINAFLHGDYTDPDNYLSDTTFVLSGEYRKGISFGKQCGCVLICDNCADGPESHMPEIFINNHRLSYLRDLYDDFNDVTFFVYTRNVVEPIEEEAGEAGEAGGAGGPAGGAGGGAGGPAP